MPLFSALKNTAIRVAHALAPQAARLRAWVASRSRKQWLMAVLALPVALLLYVLLLIPLTPSISDIQKAKVEAPTQLMSADGKVLAQYKRSNREWVALKDISPNVINALISTEDHRFYEHGGLDWRRTFGSVIHTAMGRPQGGSTITQQLARNMFPEEIGRARSLNRKLKEAVTAYKIESAYTKDEILETYLNTVPFLYNAFGIEMAARTYFDKPASKLSVIEAATLVGMLKGTSYYNPVSNPERAVSRRNTVLAQMHKHDKLGDKEFEALKKRPIQLDFERQDEAVGMAPHFAQALRKWLIDWADANDYNLYADGLVVQTTIDSRIQQWANQAVARHGRQLQVTANGLWSPRAAFSAKNPLVQSFVRESKAYRQAVEGGEDKDEALKRLLADADFMADLRQDKVRVQAGFMAMDPRNAHVLAWVGSRDFAIDPFDHVSQARRQPGSTFKPFVYGAALLNGAVPSDQLMDEAVDIALPGGQHWRPTDGGPPSNQPMTLADGLAYSKNTITAQVMAKVGPAKVAKLARALGVRDSKLDEVMSLALGTSPVTLQEMVTSYATLANGGGYRAPVMVTRITNREGKVLAEFEPQPTELALDSGVTYALVDMMRGVISKGTGRGVARYSVTGDWAGKTGTTQDNADGWFMLMHSDLVAGAWVGFNDSRVTLNDYWGQGAHSALPIVADIAAAAQRTKLVDAAARFEQPAENNTFVQRLRSWMLGFGTSKEPVDPFEQPPAVQGPANNGGDHRPPVVDDPEARPIGTPAQPDYGTRGPSGEGDYPAFNGEVVQPQAPRPNDPVRPQPGVVVPGPGAAGGNDGAQAAPAPSLGGTAPAPRGNPPPIERGVVVSPVNSGVPAQQPSAGGDVVWRRATPASAQPLPQSQTGEAGISAGEVVR
ncbi:transglycosylase domain-containing protein [Comamonas odontotermitis]|uniref:transglycosylase domain-containing protein n=1 Tax=Comamonas odontotermitis TaxID=379895 RepID=UPI00366F728D